MTDKPNPGHIFLISRKGTAYVRLPLPGSGITIDPAIQGGVPCLRNTRIPAHSVAGKLQAGDSLKTVGAYYEITEAQARACYKYIYGEDWEEKG